MDAQTRNAVREDFEIDIGVIVKWIRSHATYFPTSIE